MKRRLLFFMVISAVFFSSATPSTGRSLEEIRRTGEIRVCLSPLHPSVCTAEPEGCREDCLMSGPAYEVAMAFVAHLGGGISPRFIRVDWDEQFFNQDGITVQDEAYSPALLASGRCDFYPNNLTRNDWRWKKIDFVTLFPNRKMVLVRSSERERFKTEADLAGKTAVAEKSTSYHTWLLEQNQGAFFAQPVTVRLQPVDEGFRAVAGGLADFTMIDADAAIWAIRNQYADLDMAFAVGPTDEIGWGFRKEDKDLQEAARQFFEQQRADDRSDLNRIWQKYYGMTLTGFIDLVSSIPQ